MENAEDNSMIQGHGNAGLPHNNMPGASPVADSVAGKKRKKIGQKSG